jgi:hypothetical protein
MEPPVGLWLGVRAGPLGDRLVCLDPVTDQEIGDYSEVSQERAAAEARTAAEAQARAAAEAQTAEAEASAAAEAQARAALEAQLRAMEAEMRRLRGEP